jgi:hypothetical protein
VVVQKGVRQNEDSALKLDNRDLSNMFPTCSVANNVWYDEYVNFVLEASPLSSQVFSFTRNKCVVGCLPLKVTSESNTDVKSWPFRAGWLLSEPLRFRSLYNAS